jgi:hypothetical protein
MRNELNEPAAFATLCAFTVIAIPGSVTDVKLPPL